MYVRTYVLYNIICYLLLHTDRYMNYNSHHHARIKSGIIKCLKTRAETVCDTTRLSGELNHLKQVFRANGYPTRTINHNLKNHPTPEPPTHTEQEQTTKTEEQEQTIQTEDQERTTPIFLHLPYVKGVSERIERKCRNLGIRTTFKSKGNLREALV